MNNLEKMIKENRELFMDQEPSDGHFERFEQKLNKQNARKRTISLSYRISRIAAVGLLMIMSSLWAYNEFIKPEETFLRLGEINQEYSEIEFYYTSQINNKFDELQNTDFADDPAFKEDMLTEISEMDSVYSQLQKEMGENPGDERIVEAMIMHYQTKLRVISEILERLKEYQNINSNNNQNQYESVKL